MFVAGCAVWPLGEDPQGKEYRIQANLVVEAIVRYKTESGVSPASLAVLVPEYIQELPEVTNDSFYSNENESLMYNYSPLWPQQGQSSCSTVIGSGKRGCHGYI